MELHGSLLNASENRFLVCRSFVALFICESFLWVFGVGAVTVSRDVFSVFGKLLVRNEVSQKEFVF